MQITVFLPDKLRFFKGATPRNLACGLIPINYRSNTRINEQTNYMTKISDKFKNIQAVTYSTYQDELIINFSGFTNEEDLKEFADFVFAKIKMRYIDLKNMPSIH